MKWKKHFFAGRRKDQQHERRCHSDPVDSRLHLRGGDLYDVGPGYLRILSLAYEAIWPAIHASGHIFRDCLGYLSGVFGVAAETHRDHILRRFGVPRLDLSFDVRSGFADVAGNPSQYQDWKTSK
jgi:hypothetical protein